MTRIAVITADVLGERMAGPAIRAFNVAEQLAAAGHDVTLISTAECAISHASFVCRHAPWSSLRKAVGDAEVVVFQGFVSYHAPWLMRSDKILVIDLYDPMHLEQLEHLKDRTSVERRATHDVTIRVLNEQLARGDFFLCASEEQRHLWLGQLAAFGRLNPENYDRDPSLRALLAVCPFGLPAQAPHRTGPAIRGVVEGIGAEDKVILWAGGVYNWFDPLTLVRAVDQVRASHPDARLYFLGMQHPNPTVPAMRAAWETQQLAGQLGLTGKHVFFNEGWVDYDARQNFLLDADLGVSTHYEHLETAFSFRTRILDYLWAGLPIVATSGDTFGRLIDAGGLGVTVPEQDVDALVEALTRTLYDGDFAASCRRNVEQARPEFVWTRVLAPLLEFCREPVRSADADADRRRFVRRPVMPAHRIGRDALRGWTLLRQGGLGLVGRRVVARARRVRRER
jgi:glycosyltransferase involved in cell wall biosynthesis